MKLPKFRIRKERGKGEPASKMLSLKEVKEMEKNEPKSKGRLQWLKQTLLSRS